MALERSQSDSAQCTKCGYSLAGLATGARCPECGTTSVTRMGNRYVDTLCDAPMWYLKRLRLGLLAMSLSMACAAVVMGYSGYYQFTLAGTLLSIKHIEHYLAGSFLFCSLGWFARVWIAAGPRPKGKRTSPDAVLDSARYRKVVGIGQAFLPLSVVLLWGAWVVTGGVGGAGGIIGWGLLVLGSISLALAVLALVPMSVYLASVADWAGESSLGYRMRGAAWVIAVLGTAAIFFFVFSMLPVAMAGIFYLFTMYAMTINIFAVLVIAITIFMLARTTQWAIINNGSTAARNARLADKLRAPRGDDAQRSLGEPAVDPNVCRGCGIDLSHLGRSGRCPECHTVFVKEEQAWTPDDLRRGIPLEAGSSPGTQGSKSSRAVSRIMHIPRAISKARVRYRPSEEISRGLPRAQSGFEGMHRVNKPGPPPIDGVLDDLPEDSPGPSNT